MEIIEAIRKNIECLLNLKKGDTKYINIKGDTEYIKGDTEYIKGDTKYIKGDTKYIKGDPLIQKTSKYDYFKYILIFFILLIGGFIIVNMIKGMDEKSDDKKKTNSNISKQLPKQTEKQLPKKLPKKTEKQLPKQLPKKTEPKQTIKEKQEYIKSPYDFCFYKVNSNDDTCYLNLN